MDPIQRIVLHSKDFTKAEKKISEYILENMNIVTSYPLMEIAKKGKFSKSALLRFCQKCDYSGFAEFKYDVSRYIQSGSFDSLDDSQNTKHILEMYTSRIKNLSKSLTDKKLIDLALLIKNAHKIKIYGVHETGLSATYLQYRLLSLGIDSESCTLTNTMNEKALLSNVDDLNIFLSLSARTDIIVEAIQSAIQSKSKTVLLTENDRFKQKDQLTLFLSVDAFDYSSSKSLFLDSQAVFFVCIDLIINALAKTLKDNK